MLFPAAAVQPSGNRSHAVIEKTQTGAALDDEMCIRDSRKREVMAQYLVQTAYVRFKVQYEESRTQCGHYNLLLSSTRITPVSYTHLHGILRQIDLVAHQQPHRAVDAAAGIPAAVGFQTVICNDLQQVVGTIFQVCLLYTSRCV